jgi:ribonucleoside-diphosphate reductase alpha chain
MNMEWNSQREAIFLDRYALRDDYGELLEHTPEEMWERVATTIADTPQEVVQFRDILKNWKFVPGGRILSGAKSGKRVTLYNCFVLSIGDSRKEIMKTMGNMIEISSMGGGIGVNWSILRPAGTYIKGVNSTSSGPIAWQTGADELANAIKQGGTRTSAMMFLMDCWHPDIEEFVLRAERFKRANYSVAISHQFMKALEENDDWPLEFPDVRHPDYDSLWSGDLNDWKRRGLPIIVHKTIRAQELWDKILKNALETGSPGLVFMDRANEMSNTWYIERYICTNPCGEQILGANQVCNLGAINLLAHMTYKNQMNRTLLGNTIRSAIRFLDNVIDKSETILPEIEEKQLRDRRVGLGVMGLADILILEGIKYGSEQCKDYLEDLFSFIRDTAYEASVAIAKEKGPALGFDSAFFSRGNFIRTLPRDLQHDIATYGIRNLGILTQAPTGTSGILAGASSGCEPIFDKSYTRTDATGTHEMNHPFAEYPEFITALELSTEEHILVQSTIQKYLDSSISKTINMDPCSTVDEVDFAYRLAYDKGCKGITIYANKGEGVCVSCNI